MDKFARGGSIVAAVFPVVALFASVLPSEAAKTYLYIQNPSNMGVYTVITVNLPASINDIRVEGSSGWVKPPGPPLPDPAPTGLYYTCPPSTQGCNPTPTQGFFYMRAGAQLKITGSSDHDDLKGVSVCFLQPPHCCPGAANGFYPFTPQFTAPNGTNYAEVTLNVSTGEDVDLSCNNGANSIINVTSAGGPAWHIPTGTVADFNITNSWVNGTSGQDNNCGKQGIFPFQYTECTGGSKACNFSPNNTSCPTKSPTSNGPCEYSRPPGENGGMVTVRFIGTAKPPL